MKFSSFGKIDWGIIISLLLGAGAFFLLYSELLNVNFVDSIVNMGYDPYQSYIGWELFRSSSWTFPIGKIVNLSYPVGVPVTFTDSIPLFAFIFKLFRAWLPFPFQYIGIWQLLSIMLQGMFSYLILKHYFKQKILAVLGSIFFILSPTMLFRLNGHFALGAHWLLLWSLYLNLKSTSVFKIKQWTAIIVLSLLTHPYLFIMCGALFMADLLQHLFVTKTLQWKKALYILIAEMLLTILAAWIVGIFAVGNSGAPGFGIYSVDLNALFNPDGWSTIIQNMNVRWPNEGFNYLGLGVIALGILSVYEYFRAGDYRNLKNLFVSRWPIILVSLAIAATAITNTISFFGKEIFVFPLPEFLKDNVFGIVRSSGRLFWPVYYLIVLGAFSVLRKIKTPFAYVLIIAALFLQIYDIHDKLQQYNNFYQKMHWESPLQNTFWQDASKQYKHIFFVKSYVNKRDDAIAFFAAQNRMTMNLGLFARDVALINKKETDEEETRLKQGIVDKKTLYVFRSELEAKEMTQKVDLLQHHLIIVDGYPVLAP